MDERWLSVGEAADYAAVHHETIRRWIKSKRLPARRTVGGHHQIRVADIDELMVSGPARPAPNANDLAAVIDSWTLQADDLAGWRPPKRMSEDDLAELRYKLVGFDNSGGLVGELIRWANRITEDLHRRDSAAVTRDQIGSRPACFAWTDTTSVDTYDDLVDWHAGRCAICGVATSLHDDFDPDTGSLRGLVCSGCLKRLDRAESAPILDAYRAHPPAEILYLELDRDDVARANRPAAPIGGGAELDD